MRRSCDCSGAETQDILNDRVMSTAAHTILLLGDRRTDLAAARDQLTALGQCVAHFPEEERYDVTSTSTFNGLITVFTFTRSRVLAAQIHAVGRDTDLVLMTMGGNDIHFSALVRDCLVLPSVPACRAVVTTAHALLPGVQASMTSVLSALAAQLRPGTEVALVSYPYLV